MNYLKKFEKIELNQKFEFIDIINILQEYIDDGYSVIIYSATGADYYPNDINNVAKVNNFRFVRWLNDSYKSFKFRIDFMSHKNYSELAKFLDDMSVSINRFNDSGFYLQYFRISSSDSDVYSAYGVEFFFFGKL